VDCHASDFSVSQDQCLKCHGRQKKEIAIGYSDVHRDAGMNCWECHSSEDLHGDGTEYNSMLEDGAIKADCENCHYEGGSAPVEDHSVYDPHGGKLHCTTCHAQTVLSCYNCHFESQVEDHNKRAYKPISDFILLVNREKDGKVYPATFQSLSHQGNAWIAMGPFTSHTITDEGRGCDDCHNNEVVSEYWDTGEIKFAEWNEADSSLSWKHGIVPIPPDYETSFKMDFITYDGETSDPVAPSKNWSKIGKDSPDGFQLLFATPLTEQQMGSLEADMSTIVNNFETSLHGTRVGKPTWYDKENGGFETLTNVPIEDIGCVECHGPTDASGNPYPDDYSGGTCGDCHNDDTGEVTQAQCLSCHGRQKTEIMKLQLADVHRDRGMECMDCHGFEDLHGDGNVYTSMLDDGAIKADCENCHEGIPETHSGMDHQGKLHCTACHSETVISCYNCHFESQVESHNKRAYKPISDFVMLVNREKDGKVYPATFQSLTYQGDAWVAMGPFTSHSIKREARTCNECHQNMGGSIEAIEDYNATGKIQFSTWNDEDSTLSWKHGIVPIPEDYETSLKLDFITYNGSTEDPVAPSKNWSKVKGDWDGIQLLYAEPMSKAQMSKLGFDTTLTRVETLDQLPAAFSLSQNYPNPFNPATIINYSLAELSDVELKVYDTIGNLVEVLVSSRQTAGSYQVTFDASNLTSGVYFYSLTAGNFKSVKKLILIK
jgi:hypothetical protein